MDIQEFRLEALKMAHDDMPGAPEALVIQRAMKYLDFIIGQKSPTDAKPLQAVHQ